jgi:gluconolactonase
MRAVQRIHLVVCAGLLAGLAGCLGAQNPRQEPATVERLSPEIDRIVPKGAVLEKLADGFKWTEGPVWIPAGYLLFAEIPSNRILKWTPNAGVSVFLTPSGYKGSEPYGGPEPGSNGMTLDQRGRLTVAGHAQRDVWRMETMNPHGTITILADHFQGKRLNSPNDVVYKSDGALYFTDPPYGFRTQSDSDKDKELAFNGVYRLPGAASAAPGSAPQNAKLIRLAVDLPRPNGIAFSPDEHVLYVNNSEPKKIWMKYPVQADGTVGAGSLFFDATSDKRPGSPDGMKVDQAGNIYSTGPGGIWIFSPAGKHIGTIDIPEKAANVAWGEADAKTLYITASTGLYRIRLDSQGIRPH